jgi:predicted ATPase/DNA-binding CsgD family transcriptional regulator
VPNAPVAPLLGREAELAELRLLLSQDRVRFLTVTGPGGIGKTRLAQALISDEVWSAGRSVHFVDLSVVDDPALVPISIAQALHLQESGSETIVAMLRNVVAQTVALLVLDSFERVTGAAAFIADLLSAGPGLSFLVTSREPLHIRAERVFPLGPLPVPSPDLADLGAIVSTPAVALFEDRGRARQPDFSITELNAAAVTEICRRLDGLPLAIELAAAQIGVLTPNTILARLEAREPFVLGGAPDLPTRHRTLGAAVGWSYDLLSPVEQHVFRRCGIFSGSFEFAAVAALIDEALTPPRDLLGVLAQLVDKNLMQLADPTSDVPRFRQLETIRAFALDALANAGEFLEAHRRHAGYFADLAEQAEKQLVGPAMASTLDQIEREYDNCRAALSWSLESGELVVGLRLAGALHRFWMLRGHLGEARQWLERALPRSADVSDEVRAKALNAAGVLAGMQADNETAEAYFRESFRLWESVGDPVRMAAAMGNLGLAAQNRQDVDVAMGCFHKAEELYTVGGDRRGIAVSMGSRAHLFRQEGQTHQAVELFHEVLALFREVGDPRGIANSLANLGHAVVALGRPERSLEYFREALELRRELGNTLGIAECLEGFAAAAAARRQSRRAARLLGAAAALRESTGAPLPSIDRKQQDAVLRRVHQQLQPEVFIREEGLGRLLNVDQAIQFALMFNVPDQAARTGRLSERERQVAELVARGLTNRQIGDTLLLSRRTVGTHLEHIFSKLGVQTRAEVAVWITRNVGDASDSAVVDVTPGDFQARSRAAN